MNIFKNIYIKYVTLNNNTRVFFEVHLVYSLLVNFMPKVYLFYQQ